MRRSTAEELNRLNAQFYQAEAESFSATRQSSWPGWERCWTASGLSRDISAANEGHDLRVLDVACGNLRFARFLEQAAPGWSVAYCGVDNNQGLGENFKVPAGWHFSFCEQDIVGELLARESRPKPGVPEAIGKVASSGFDLTVCFGFLHHVPTSEARVRLLNELLDATVPGGVCCVSFWRFMSDPKLAAKARRTTEEGLLELGLTASDLDEGDFLVGWQNQPHVFRYCHSFSDAEVDALLERLDGNVELVDRFRADGRSGKLNEYLVLRRS